MRLWEFHDRKLSRKVRHAYQALALDDERKTFHPNVWRPPDAAAEAPTCNGQPLVDQVIEQVWFAGVHSNVGGSYPKDSLSLVPLDWMMGKAHRHGLRFLPDAWKAHREQADTYGRLYDSRTGSGAFYRYAPRDLYTRPEEPPKTDVGFVAALVYTLRYLFGRLGTEPVAMPHIHQSVFDRIARGTGNYAPKIIGEHFEVATTDVWPYSEQKGNDDGA